MNKEKEFLLKNKKNGERYIKFSNSWSFRTHEDELDYELNIMDTYLYLPEKEWCKEKKRYSKLYRTNTFYK